jgi:hypothetical protein
LGDMDWIGLVQDRKRRRALVNSVLNLQAPWNAGKLSSGLTSGGLSCSAQLHIYNSVSFLRKQAEVLVLRLGCGCFHLVS